MSSVFNNGISRRALLVSSMGAVFAVALPLRRPLAAAGEFHEFHLTASPASAQITPKAGKTATWAYNGSVPGPLLRVRQGDNVRVTLDNRLAEETTIHWHGMRVPNGMDGVPHLTQKPVGPGEKFVYEFVARDAGSYWYHPHQRSFEQVDRGLAGAFIVDEKQPLEADRDMLWMLDDWRLDDAGQITDDFGGMHDMTHSGRIGNWLSLNGRPPGNLTVRRGERIRLRVINAANARIFALGFAGHTPQIIALDGQPVEPHTPEFGRIVLGPSMRADIILDMMGQPGARFAVSDNFYPGMEYSLLDIVYDDSTPLRTRPLDAPIHLPANPLAEPDLALAERHEIVFGGGMMGGMGMAMMDGRSVGMREMMGNRMAWAVNGVVATGHLDKPIFTLRRGSSHILALNNDTAWHHPIHLHGHVFRLVSRNGKPTRLREWGDTVLLAPREQAEIAFAADNPGDWMLHCHILEHQQGGMMTTIRVS